MTEDEKETESKTATQTEGEKKKENREKSNQIKIRIKKQAKKTFFIRGKVSFYGLISILRLFFFYGHAREIAPESKIQCKRRSKARPPPGLVVPGVSF